MFLCEREEREIKKKLAFYHLPFDYANEVDLKTLVEKAQDRNNLDIKHV
jgi:hypothetical protein